MPHTETVCSRKGVCVHPEGRGRLPPLTQRRRQRNEEGKVENYTHIKRCVFYLSPTLGNVGSRMVKLGKGHFKGVEKPS